MKKQNKPWAHAIKSNSSAKPKWQLATEVAQYSEKVLLQGLMLARAKTPEHQIQHSHMHGWRSDPSNPLFPSHPPKKKLFDFFFPPSQWL